MPGLLTKKARVDAEKARIATLTHPHNQYFKLIFSHQIGHGFEFGDFHRRSGGPLPHRDIVNTFRALGNFIDESTKLTISDVEAEYKRKPFKSDGTFDPELGIEVAVEHLCLFKRVDPPLRHADSVRLHGYFRASGGYFVATKIDWFHKFATK